MIKYKWFIYILLSGFLVTAMTCEDYEPEITLMPATLTSMELTHLDNSGKDPVVSTSHRIAREAYMLRIRLIIDAESYDKTQPYEVPQLTDPIRKIEIYASATDGARTDGTTGPATETHVTNRFKDYPIPLEDHLYDTTSSGKLLSECKQTSIYKALSDALPAGSYTFRVACIQQSGEILEAYTTAIEFY